MTAFPGERNISSAANQAPVQVVPGNGENMAPAVVARDLVRVFGQKVAVNHLNLSVKRGEFYGFLGRMERVKAQQSG